jgi:glucokinase
MSAPSLGEYWVGFDLGGTKMLAAVFDSAFKAVGRERKKTKGHEGTESVTSRIISTIHAALANASVTATQLRGIGVGCPGPVDQARGIVHEAVNLGWNEVRLGELLENEFGVPVVVTNDVDAGVYGEYRFGAGQGAHTVVGVFPGTGIGGGCVFQGEIIRGSRSSCMEIGHIQVNRNGRLCGCGRRGCLETEASRLAIAAEVAAASFRGETPCLHQQAGTDLSQIRSGVLAQAIRDGDRVVEDIVCRAAERLGVAVAMVVHLLAPDVVILGGGLVEAMPELLVKHVRSAAQATVMPSFEDSFRVEVAQLGDDATILGSAAWAQKRATELAESAC